MKQNKKAKIVFIVLLVLGVAAVGLAVWEICTNGFSVKTAGKLAAFAAAWVLAIARMYSAAGGGSKKLYALYEKEYSEHIHGAFSRNEQKKEKKLLMNAIHCFNAGRYTKGIGILQNLVPKCAKPCDYAAVYTFLALMYEQVDKPENAMKAYQAVLKYDDTRSTVWSNLGRLHRKKGYHREAIECYKKALEADPKNEYAYNNMGNSYFRLGEYQKAVDLAKKALELKPAFVQALELLCTSYAAMGDEAKCKEYFDLSVSSGGNPAALQNVLKVIREGNLAKDSYAPVPYEIDKACDLVYRETALPFIRIGLTGEDTNSRFGGPALGTAPLDESGNEMKLLCGIDCSEVRGLADFPESGWLLFYIADNELYGADFDNPTSQKNFRVIYRPEAALAEGDTPVLTDAFPVQKRYNIALTPDICPMNYCDYRFEDILNKHLAKSDMPKFNELEEDTREDIAKRFCTVGHSLYGTPMFAQYDPRESEEYQKYDTLLLQVFTHRTQNETKIQIGDEGAIQFFIPKENLKNKDFSDILYWWDCY